jgi:hypothetical protein
MAKMNKVHERAWEMAKKANGPAIWTATDMVYSHISGVVLGVCLMLVASVAFASPIVFNFSSPSFSGVGQSSHYLTIENLEKARKQAIIDKAEAEQRRLDNELKNTAIEIFRRNLESMFYTALAGQIIDNVFGEDGDKQQDGRTTIDGYKVIWTISDTQDDENGTNVWIRDELTNEIIWKYTFPFQEAE